MIHRINPRVAVACAVLALGLATNAWKKNIVSGLAITASVLALAVWWGSSMIVKPPKE